jgi:hypothetical protein
MKNFLAIAFLLACNVSARAAEEVEAFATLPTVQPPAARAVYQRLEAWLVKRKTDARVRDELRQLWLDVPQTDASLVLDRLAASFATVDPRARELVEACSRPRSGWHLPKVDWLAAADTPEFEADNLRLYYARWLAHEQLYDELREQVNDLAAEAVVDPATLLFCQSVAYHRLLERDAGMKAIDRLLTDVAEVPARYKIVAELMKGDLEELDPENLDHIARRMDDIRRRLALGRAGKQVRTVEDGVIASLDKLIEDMEKQQQQQQQQAAGGAVMRPSSPMQDSKLAPLKGPGQVDHKPIGNTAGWGDMPAREREAALQQIGKDFPPHYRDAIEQYFRRLASEGSSRTP